MLISSFIISDYSAFNSQVKRRRFKRRDSTDDDIAEDNDNSVFNFILDDKTKETMIRNRALAKSSSRRNEQGGNSKQSFVKCFFVLLLVACAGLAVGFLVNQSHNQQFSAKLNEFWSSINAKRHQEFISPKENPIEPITKPDSQSSSISPPEITETQSIEPTNPVPPPVLNATLSFQDNLNQFAQIREQLYQIIHIIYNIFKQTLIFIFPLIRVSLKFLKNYCFLFLQYLYKLFSISYAYSPTLTLIALVTITIFCVLFIIKHPLIVHFYAYLWYLLTGQRHNRTIKVVDQRNYRKNTQRATIAYKSSSTKNTSSNTLNSETSSTQSDQEQQFEELKALYELPEKPTIRDIQTICRYLITLSKDIPYLKLIKEWLLSIRSSYSPSIIDEFIRRIDIFIAKKEEELNETKSVFSQQSSTMSYMSNMHTNRKKLFELLNMPTK